MNFASNFAYVAPKPQSRNIQLGRSRSGISDDQQLNLNVFVVTFEGMKEAEKNLGGGDPYYCKECRAILNKYSNILNQQELIKSETKLKVELQKHQSLWQCEFCSFPNIISIEKEQIPTKMDVVYMVESEHEVKTTQKDQTLVFCIDVSGSMNSTSEIQGKVDLKYGISQEQIDMLKQFMEPGDEAQFNFYPGQHPNKTFISRKQCILSAIQSQLSQIRKVDPLKKIGFVTFNNQVTVIGDTKSEDVHLVGDKLYNKEAILNSLTNFSLHDPIVDSFDNLLNTLNKTQAKGQTALGPALVAAIDVAAKGNLGSSVILCTDGLANVGIGQLEPFEQGKRQFYLDLAEVAKSKNIVVNIVTIKGEGCKIETIGKLSQLTNGNIKVVNPEKLSEDFANVLKDQVVGLNVTVRVLLHKSMIFRNQQKDNLKEQGSLLQKILVNATKNTRVSFQYEVRGQQELKGKEIDLSKLKYVPFQAVIEYTSPKGGKFLRVISSQCETTIEAETMKKNANLGVVHQRITSQTAALYNKGSYKDSTRFNNKWANYLNENFKEKGFREHQQKFIEKNERLKKAIKHRHRKSIQKKQKLNQSISEEQLEIVRNNSEIQSDDDQRELVDNLMERQNYSISKKERQASPLAIKKERLESPEPLKKEYIRKNSVEKSGRKKSISRKKSVEKSERKKSITRARKASFASDDEDLQ